MIETAIALLTAHVAADFLLQFAWIIRNKTRPAVFALHMLIVFATGVSALGAFSTRSLEPWIALAIVVPSHGALDAAKTYGFGDAWLRSRPRWNFAVFSLDQIAHVAAIVVAAWIAPRAFAEGWWAWNSPDRGAPLLELFALGAGFVVATRTAQFAIGIFMERFRLPGLEHKDASGRSAAEDAGLNHGGAWIGLLERALVFGLVLIGRFDAIGFLIAAKSVLRFQYARDRSHSEYVIIGTLMSFSWAIAVALLTRAGLQMLAPG